MTNPAFERNVRAEWPDKADTVLGLIRGTIEPETFESVHLWVTQCFHPPSRGEKVMLALNEVLDCYGVEYVPQGRNSRSPAFEYLNTGDTYALTLVRFAGTYRVSSWGDIVERGDYA